MCRSERPDESEAIARLSRELASVKATVEAIANVVLANGRDTSDFPRKLSLQKSTPIANGLYDSLATEELDEVRALDADSTPVSFRSRSPAAATVSPTATNGSWTTSSASPPPRSTVAPPASAPATAQLTKRVRCSSTSRYEGQARASSRLSRRSTEGKVFAPTGSYGDESEQEQRLEGIVEGYLESLGVGGGADPTSAACVKQARHRASAGGFRRTSRAAGLVRGPVGLVSRLRPSVARVGSPRARSVSSPPGGALAKSRLHRLCDASGAWWPVLRSDHPLLPLWDSLTLLCMGYLAAALPLYVGWRHEIDAASPHGWAVALPVLHVGIDVLVALDVLVQMRRGYLQDGMAVHDPYKVMLRYAKSELTFDLVAALPYLAIAHALPPSARSGVGAVLLTMIVELRVVLRG